MSERKRVVPGEGWEVRYWDAKNHRIHACPMKADELAYLVGFICFHSAWRLYHATTQQWAEWDEALGGWVEAPAPDAQVTLPPAIPQEPEGMLLEGVLAELYDSANGSVAQERVGRLLARYQELTGKRAPEFLRGH